MIGYIGVMMKKIFFNYRAFNRTKMNHYRMIFCASVVAFLFAGCNQISQSFKDTFKQPAQGEKQGTSRMMKRMMNEVLTKENYLDNAGYLRGVKQKLEDLPKFKGKSLQVYSDIHFYDDGRVMLSLRDPDILENVDSYTFRDGEWQEPEPVQVSSRVDLDQQVLSLDSIDFGTVTKLYNYLSKESEKIDGAEDVNHIYLIIRPTLIDNQWYSSVQGARGTYSLRAMLSGEIIKFERD